MGQEGSRDLPSLKLVETERKGKVLTKAQFGCLRHVYTLNVTQGCEFECAYCYARGYPGAPTDGEVRLYGNLPEQLEKELDNPRRRTLIPWVSFNTASDSFQSHPQILEITYQSMRLFLERGIGLSFLTKGIVPDRFVSLFSRYPGLVSPRIGLVSASLRYRDVFEPGAASPDERIGNIRRLRRTGMDAEVRIDPIIPFYTDDDASIRGLLEALAQVQIQTVTLSYLHLRPAILDQ
jgi:DNA repair photolyase